MASIDRRIVKTKKAIRAALRQLLAEKPRQAITVTDVARTADINRATFYTYYPDVDAVIAEAEDEVTTALTALLEDVDWTAAFQRPTALFAVLHQLVVQDYAFYHGLATEDVGGLLEKIGATLKARLQERVPADYFPDDVTKTTVIDYTVGGLVAVYRRWLQDPQVTPQAPAIVSQLALKGISSVADFPDDVLGD
ncbi:TetR/AcrR family transcriptional regulator [Schleiferilactobacillus shenzhenensis]|uniref:YxbF n=1 Tax=Schleiferilactobacillus shenzhenensis LY-73 TaxID=1231336 RepID=U4TR99_9LACO|nr:TetR/AcrR family transcriptional regulator [Schleiferilactobacillus shenzhenensis]ERL65980.1 YxbF [Schleiferilactobacillus shenzhenensis LY-73]